MFNLLDGRDRKILALLGFLVVLGLVILFVFGFRQKVAYTRSANSLSRQQNDLISVSASSEEKQAEWQKWEQTQLDIEELREKYFYNSNDGIVQLRRDLQKIFRESRIRASDKRYEYSPAERNAPSSEVSSMYMW